MTESYAQSGLTAEFHSVDVNWAILRQNRDGREHEIMITQQDAVSIALRILSKGASAYAGPVLPIQPPQKTHERA